MPIIDHLPPKCKVLIKMPPANMAGEGTVQIELNAVVAAGDDADAMWREFGIRRHDEVNAAMTEARERFLQSEQWLNIKQLRDKLAQLSHVEKTAQQELNKARAEFQEGLKTGDTRLLAKVSHKSTQWNMVKTEYEELDKHLTQLEQNAANKLRDDIKSAHHVMQMQAHAEFHKLLDQLVASIDKRTLVALAVLENIMMSSGMPPTIGPSAPGKPNGPDVGAWDAIPERNLAVIPASVATPPSPQPTATGPTWGPSGTEHPETPNQWGPSAV